MTINIENSEQWVIATNGVDVFTSPIKLEKHNQLTTGQPHVVRGDSLDELLNKVYKSVKLYSKEDGDVCEEDLFEGYDIGSFELRNNVEYLKLS